MANMQKQMDNAFAELDVIEEMLRPLVAARKLHQRGDFEVRLPITQTKEFQLLGWWLEQRVNQLQNQILSWIIPEAYQRHFLDYDMLSRSPKSEICPND